MAKFLLAFVLFGVAVLITFTVAENRITQPKAVQSTESNFYNNKWLLTISRTLYVIFLNQQQLVHQLSNHPISKPSKPRSPHCKRNWQVLNGDLFFFAIIEPICWMLQLFLLL